MMGGGDMVDEAREQAEPDRTDIVLELDYLQDRRCVRFRANEICLR